MSKWVVTVPNFRPPSLNALIGCGPGKRCRLKKECADLIGVYAVIARVPKVDPASPVRRRLRFQVHGAYRGRIDPDNYLKALLDGCKTAGLIHDDGEAWCVWERPEVVPFGDRKLVIELSEDA